MNNRNCTPGDAVQRATQQAFHLDGEVLNLQGPA